MEELNKSFIGNIEQFNHETEDFENYIERLQEYFKANEVAEGRKVSALLTIIGPKTYAILKNITYPEDPRTKTF